MNIESLKLSKSNIKDHLLYDSISIKYREQTNLYKQKADCTRARERRVTT